MNKNLKISQMGMSMVEIMMALGLLGAISLGVMKVMENSQKASHNLKTTDEILQVSNEINAVLSSPLNCQRSFFGYGKDQAPLGIYSYVRGTPVLKHSAASAPANDKATLKSILVKNIDINNDASRSLAEIELTFNKTLSSTRVGGKEVKRSIKLNVNLCPQTLLIENPSFNFGAACSGVGKRIVAGPYDMKLQNIDKRWAACQDCTGVNQYSTIFSCSSNSSGGAGVDVNNMSKLNCLSMGGVFDEADSTCKIGNQSVQANISQINSNLCDLEKKMLGQTKEGGNTTLCSPNIFIKGNGLINGVHTTQDCIVKGGAVNSTHNFCEFNTPVCPIGWEPYNGWKAFGAQSFNGSGEKRLLCPDCNGDNCTAQAVNFAQSASASTCEIKNCRYKYRIPPVAWELCTREWTSDLRTNTNVIKVGCY
jgi:Tfp pilus assembly protein PilV